MMAKVSRVRESHNVIMWPWVVVRTWDLLLPTTLGAIRQVSLLLTRRKCSVPGILVVHCHVTNGHKQSSLKHHTSIISVFPRLRSPGAASLLQGLPRPQSGCRLGCAVI